MKKELVAIDRWLNKKGNTKALLAAKLGYSSSSVVQQWFRRNRIPAHMEKRIMEAINVRASN